LRAQSRAPAPAHGYKAAETAMTSSSLAPAITAMQNSMDADVFSAAAESDAVDGVMSAVVARPRNTDELCRILAAANREGLAVAPRGGGAHLAIGNSLKRLDIVVDISALNRIVQHNAADLTLVVEAGITLAALRRALAKEGQFLALDASLPQRATIGGILAAGVSGPLKWHYGSARDLVIGMQVAQADGRLTRSGGQVVKNVSGYDMARLHVGGLGTLGVITEVSFKLTPMPRRESTLVAQFKSYADCAAAAMSIFNSGAMPLAMTAYNHAANKRIGAAYGARGGSALAVRLGGRPRTLQRLENETFAILSPCADAVDRMDDGAATAYWATLADFGYAAAKPIMSARVSVLPNRVAQVVDAIAQCADVAILAQVGYGMLNAHWFDQELDLGETLRHARDAVHSAGGSLIVERAPLSVKAGIDVWDYNGDSLAIMRGLKAQYDPNRILNPNRFAGGI